MSTASDVGAYSARTPMQQRWRLGSAGNAQTHWHRNIKKRVKKDINISGKRKSRTSFTPPQLITGTSPPRLRALCTRSRASASASASASEDTQSCMESGLGAHRRAAGERRGMRRVARLVSSRLAGALAPEAWAPRASCVFCFRGSSTVVAVAARRRADATSAQLASEGEPLSARRSRS